MQLILVLLCGISCAHAVSPVEKVLSMMEDLQTQVIMEGKSEAATYDTFACFCKDMSNDKTTAISEEQDTINSLTASINQLTSDRSDLDDDIRDYNRNLKQIAARMKRAVDTRATEKQKYEDEKAELQKSIDDVQGSLDFMIGQRDLAAQGAAGSFLSLKTLKRAAVMADALGFSMKHKKVLAELLQQTPDVPTVSSSFASGDIITTIEDLKTAFLEEQASIKRVEVQNIAGYHSVMQLKTQQKLVNEKDLAEAMELKSQKMQRIGEDSEQLTATTAQLMDDQAYLKDLTDKCNLKSQEYNQRSSMRQDEITALTSAITVVKERVGTKTTATVRFVQEQSKVTSPALANVEADSTDGDAVADEADDIAATEVAASFLQVYAAPSAGDTQRDRVLALLRSSSQRLGSAVLASLASRVAADPFVKVKKLIQELIERLLQEAADEANHKGWCDKELGKARQSRQLKMDAVTTLNSRLAQNEASRDKLIAEKNKLGEEIQDLRDSLNTMNANRKAESDENAATVSEAEEGKAAIEEAMDILNEFYKTAAKAEDPELSFVQTSLRKGVDDDLPDAGFGGAYKAGQSASTGIIGMMEVIHSDFVRTIETTDKNEKSAEAEFYEFETTTKISYTKKTEAKSHKSSSIADLRNDIYTDFNDLVDEQALLDRAVQEIGELIPACIETGMSYEDRVAKREQEIESLKEALCVLDKEGPVQTEQC